MSLDTIIEIEEQIDQKDYKKTSLASHEDVIEGRYRVTDSLPFLYWKICKLSSDTRSTPL